MTRSTLLVALLACACSQIDGDNVPTYPTHPVLGVIQDAPVDGLQSFSIVVTGFRLLDESGKATGFVGVAPRRVELMGLRDEGELFASGYVFDGTYAGAQIAFDSATIEALGTDGSMVPVSSTAHSMDVSFASPVTLSGNEPLHILCDLDLARSIRFDAGTSSIQFEPSASRIHFDSGTYELGEVEGTLYAESSSPNSLVLAPWLGSAGTEGDSSAALAPMSFQVDLALDTVLIDSTGAPFFDEAAFYAALAQSAEFAEVHCDLRPDGTAIASRVELQAPAQTPSSSEVEGRIVAVDHEGSFDLLMLDVENLGSAIAPLLLQSSPPYLFTVTFSTATRFLDDATHAARSASDLAVGQRVDVLFTGSSNPLIAERVEFESAPEHRAKVAGTGSLPTGLTVRMTPTTAAVTAGLVEDDATDVTVDLTSASIFLSARGERLLEPSALVDGVQVEVSGPVEGTPTAPTVAASRLRVIAGELTGTVSGTSASTSTLDVTVTSITDPFGGAATSPPFSVTLDFTCTFEGAANSEADFFALFSGLGTGQSLRVEIVGIGTGSANEVRAYHVLSIVD